MDGSLLLQYSPLIPPFFMITHATFDPPAVVAHKSTSAEIGILRKVFQRYDTRRVGHLNFEEFRAAITAVGYTDDDYQKIFDAVVRFKKWVFCRVDFVL